MWLDILRLPPIPAAVVAADTTSLLSSGFCADLLVSELFFLFLARFLVYYYSRAILDYKGLMKILVWPSLFTAGDLYLQFGQTVVITWLQISLIRSVIRL